MNKINEVIDMSSINKRMPSQNEIKHFLSLDLKQIFKNSNGWRHRSLLFSNIIVLMHMTFPEIQFDIFSKNMKGYHVNGAHYSQSKIIEAIIPLTWLIKLWTYIQLKDYDSYNEILVVLSVEIFQVLLHELTHYQQNIYSKGAYNKGYKHFETNDDDIKKWKSWIFYTLNDQEIGAQSYSLARKFYEFKDNIDNFEETLLQDSYWKDIIEIIKLLWENLNKNEKIWINKQVKKLKRQFYNQLYKLQKENNAKPY